MANLLWVIHQNADAPFWLVYLLSGAEPTRLLLQTDYHRQALGVTLGLSLLSHDDREFGNVCLPQATLLLELNVQAEVTSTSPLIV